MPGQPMQPCNNCQYVLHINSCPHAPITQALHTFTTSAATAAEQPGVSQDAKQDATSSTPPPVTERLQQLARVVWREVREAVAPQDELTSPLRAPAVAPAQPGATTSELVYQARTASGWEKQWQDVQEKVWHFGCVACWVCGMLGVCMQ